MGWQEGGMPVVKKLVPGMLSVLMLACCSGKALNVSVFEAGYVDVVSSVAFSPDGWFTVSASSDHNLRFRDIDLNYL